MKQLKKIALIGIILCAIMAIALFASGCKSDEIPAPTQLTLDETNRLSWTEVDEARNYTIYIKNIGTGEVKEETARKANYSLSVLTEGDYEIKVKAVTGGLEAKESKWSASVYFQKQYETGCIYTLINNTEYEITRVGMASGTVKIADEFLDKPVTSIAQAAFKGSSRVEVIEMSGSNIVSIGDNAFYNCSRLTKIELPNSITSIGASAFQACRALESINIPSGVRSISDYTFAYCRSLKEIILHNEILSIGVSAFADCSALVNVVIPDSVKVLSEYAFSACSALTSVHIGKNVQELGNSAFYRCVELSSVTFAEETVVSSFGEYAFCDCKKLENIVVPKGVTNLGDWCFNGAQLLLTIDIADTVEHVGSFAFDGTKMYENAKAAGDDFIYADDWLVGCTDETKETLKKITITTLKKGVVGIADQVFSGCLELSDVILPDTVRHVGNFAFFESSLTKFHTTGNALKSIGEGAFRDCTYLKNIMLGGGLEEIGAYAFYNCSAINVSDGEEFAVIPETVTSIGQYAFRNTGLWNNAGNGVVYAGNWVIGYKGTPGTVTLKPETIGIADYAFYKCESLSAVSGLSYARYVGRGAFSECYRLAAVTLNRNLRNIEDYTFYKCYSLRNVSLPDRLETIGRSAFYKCQSLYEIDLTRTRVKTIKPYAFYDCMSLKNVTLTTDYESLELIDEYAFYNCIAIESLTIPSSMKTIGSRAFAKCSALKTLTIENGIETLGEYSFHSCYALEAIHLPDSVKTVESYAFYKCSAVTEVSFGSGIEIICDYAFYNLPVVTDINLPASIQKIGRYAFKGMESLESLVIASDITEISDYAFYGAKVMTVYTDQAYIQEEITWGTRWNASHRPVVWGCTLSEDKTYVVSVTITENTLLNINATEGFKAPVRDGYVFLGWATSPTAEQATYQANQIAEVPVGTTLYAVWDIQE